MKKLTLTFAIALAAFAWAVTTESSANSMTTKPNASETVGMTEKPQAPADGLTFEAFLMIRQYVDSSFQRLTSVSQAAMQCHMSVDRVNRLFKRFAHENAEKYLASMKSRFGAATIPNNAELAARQGTTSWPNPYFMGR